MCVYVINVNLLMNVRDCERHQLSLNVSESDNQSLCYFFVVNSFVVLFQFKSARTNTHTHTHTQVYLRTVVGKL